MIDKGHALICLTVIVVSCSHNDITAAIIIHIAGCGNCHSLDDGQEATAPSLYRLLGSTVTLADGTTVEADGAYIRRSITDPEAQVVDGGWPTSMPTDYSELFTDEKLEALALYVESLR